MKENIIRKDQLDHLIELYRELNDTLYESGDTDRVVKDGIKVAEAIEEDSGLNWLAINDFTWSVVRYLKQDATNEEVYKVLEMLGWKVKDYEAA